MVENRGSGQNGRLQADLHPDFVLFPAIRAGGSRRGITPRLD